MRLTGREVARLPAGMALVIAAGALSAGLATAQTPREPTAAEQDQALRILERIEADCAVAAAARDASALDDLTRKNKELLVRGDHGLRVREERLEAARKEIEKQRSRYRHWTVETARAQEQVDQANAQGAPAQTMQMWQRRLDGTNEKREEAKRHLVDADNQETAALADLRQYRGRLGMARVMIRSVEICVEKRRAELQPPPAITSTTPANPLDPPFSLTGRWGGGCDQGTKVNGTFTVAVAKGGAVSGQYVYSGGGSGPVSGTLGPDGKLAVGSGDSGFSVRWVGSVVATGGTRSGSGTWSGSGSGIKCGGSWSSGPPA